MKWSEAAGLHLAAALTLPLLLAHRTSAVGSHSPLDLLAYPAYTVQLRSDQPISNTSAEAILKAASSSLSGSITRDGAHPQDHGLLHVQAKSAPLPDSTTGQQEEGATYKPFLMRSHSNGQGYLCTVPQPQQQQQQHQKQPVEDKAGNAPAPDKRRSYTPEEREERRKRAEEERRLAYEKGIAALEPLKGSCLYLTQGWFTYAFCHGSEIRQFHAIKVQNAHGAGIAEDPTQDSYTLGQYAARDVEDEGLVDTKKARALGSLREILESEDKSDPWGLDVVRQPGREWNGEDDEGLGEQKRYLVQRWSAGTLCDKTGVDRRIEVQFHCNAQSSDRIFLIRETAICEYIMVIHTPRLCGVPIFAGSSSSDESAGSGTKKKAVSVIDCRPIVKDDYLTIPSTATESERGDWNIAEQEKQSTVVHQAGEPVLPAQLPVEDTDATLSVSETNVDHIQADGTPQPQSEPAGAGDGTTSDENASSSNDPDTFIDSYVLVLDPHTGEIVVQSDPDATDFDLDDLLHGSDDGSESSSEEDKALDTMEGLAQVLRKSMEEALSQMAQGIDADQNEAIVQALRKQEESLKEATEGSEPESTVGGNQIQEQHPGDTPDAASHPDQPAKPLKRKGSKDPLSRLTKSGAHNHKFVAEQFLKGQLKHKHRRGKDQAGHGYPGANAQQGKQDTSLGTQQHKDLKRAFSKGWKDEKEEGKESTKVAGIVPRDEL